MAFFGTIHVEVKNMLTLSALDRAGFSMAFFLLFCPGGVITLGWSVVGSFALLAGVIFEAPGFYRPPIMCLFIACSPTAVIRAVSFIVVYTVYGQIVTVSVGQCPLLERSEVMEPFGANCDTAPAII